MAVKSVCVFCGANIGTAASAAEAARLVGDALARRGLTLVFGGGGVGLMGVVADAALAAGGKVTGVLPRALVAKELAHPRVKDLRIVATMHERKALMAGLAEAFIALPGGYGTLDELCEILTWAQLGIHGKPCGLLNVDGFFDHFLQFLDHGVRQGFIRPEHRTMLLVERDPDVLLDLMEAYQPPSVAKWLDLRQT